MFETIKRLYRKTGDEKLVNNACEKGWITPEERDEILASK